MVWENWQLEDIQGHDVANLTRLLEKSRYEHKFEKVNKVVEAAGHLLAKALEKHGISLAAATQFAKDEDQSGDVVEALMQEKNVRVEQRMEYAGIDQWRCGFYIYKDNEIADFIGAPVKFEQTDIIHNYRYKLVATLDL